MPGSHQEAGSSPDEAPAPVAAACGEAAGAGSSRVRRLVVTAVFATAVGMAGVAAIAAGLASRHAGADAEGAVLPAASSTLSAGRRAPVGFRLARLGGGRPVGVAALLHDKPAVVNFFASWCQECASELDAFATAWHESRGRVVFLGIDTNDTDPSKALMMLRAAGAGYTVALDSADDEVTDAYGANGLPTTFFIDATGRVRFEVLGALDGPALKARLAALVSGHPAAS